MSSTFEADTVREDGTVTRVLVKPVDFDAARWWRPIASNFLKRVTRAQLRATGKKRCGSDWKVRHARDRRGMLVDALDTLFNDEADREGLGPKVRNHIDAWLAA